MVNYSVSQEWLCASEKSLLQAKTLEASDFPDPLSYYSLYCVIIKKERLNALPKFPFMPFKGRDAFAEALKEDGRDGGIRKDHGFWIEILEDFLGCPPLVEYKKDGTGDLTHFGNHMFPGVMTSFANLYHENEHLNKTMQAYTPPDV